MNEIQLNNFRCYTAQTIRFKSGINLLIGDNASGKTSLLKACKYVLSAFFSGYSDENTKWINPSIDDFSVHMTDGIIQPEKPICIRFNNDDIIEYPKLLNRPKGLGLIDIESLYSLQKNSKKNSRSLVTGIKEYKEYAHTLQYLLFDGNHSAQTHSLPLFACFSTEDIHSTRKIDVAKFKSYTQKNSFGYYECLDGNGFFPYWIKRLLILQEGQKNKTEIEVVRQAIISALGMEGCNIIYDMDIRPNQKKVYYHLADNREVASEYLSDGYKRLVNIITDIAFRCALLNRGIYGLTSAQNTRGTVLIDEVDLHLHPTLQASVLKGLRNAFPKLQFIVTTHAPMVMTGVEVNDENVVYKLSYSQENGYQVVETYTYGMDASTITEVILDQTPRDAEVEEKLKTLFEWIDNDLTEAARYLLNELQEKFGNNLPELANAEAMLNFTMENDDEENS